MTTLNGMAGYRTAYDEYEDEQYDPEQLHPQVRRQARQMIDDLKARQNGQAESHVSTGRRRGGPR